MLLLLDRAEERASPLPRSCNAFTGESLEFAGKFHGFETYFVVELKLILGFFITKDIEYVLCNDCRMNSRRSGVKLGVRASVSKRKFSFKTDAHIEKLRQIQLKKRTEKKMKWAVKAYQEWRNERLQTFTYDYPIFMSNLDDLGSLEKDNFEYSMMRFVPEVTKSKGKGAYPGRTLYQLCTSIQKYLNINRIPWKLVKGNEFQELQVVLDNVMKERASDNIGMVKKQAEVITYEYENELWQKGLLGEHDADTLRNTVLFLIGINCVLRAGDEHYYLRLRHA